MINLELTKYGENNRRSVFYPGMEYMSPITISKQITLKYPT